MGKQFKVSEVPKTGTDVGHSVQLARDKKGGRLVTMEALVQRLYSEEIGGRRCGGGGPLGLSSNSGSVVGTTGYGSFSNIECLNGDVMLHQASGEFKV